MLVTPSSLSDLQIRSAPVIRLIVAPFGLPTKKRQVKSQVAAQLVHPLYHTSVSTQSSVSSGHNYNYRPNGHRATWTVSKTGCGNTKACSVLAHGLVRVAGCSGRNAAGPRPKIILMKGKCKSDVFGFQSRGKY